VHPLLTRRSRPQPPVGLRCLVSPRHRSRTKIAGKTARGSSCLRGNWGLAASPAVTRAVKRCWQCPGSVPERFFQRHLTLESLFVVCFWHNCCNAVLEGWVALIRSSDVVLRGSWPWLLQAFNFPAASVREHWGTSAFKRGPCAGWWQVWLQDGERCSEGIAAPSRAELGASGTSLPGLAPCRSWSWTASCSERNPPK